MATRLKHPALAGETGSHAIAPSTGDCLPHIDLSRDAILLDVDGTLLDIAPTPQDVRVPKELHQSLKRLIQRTGGATALVSGRMLETLDALLAPLRIAAIGCHGAQMRRSPQSESEARATPLPETVTRTLADIPALEPQVRIEDKIFTRAFHFRRARDREQPLLRLLQERLAPFGGEFSLLRGKSVFEIRPKGCNKGEAVRALMQTAPFAGRRPVFFGDDKTDEDAFAVLHEFGGLGIVVGRRSQNADFMVHSPRDVRRWLQALGDSTGEKGNG